MPKSWVIEVSGELAQNRRDLVSDLWSLDYLCIFHEAVPGIRTRMLARILMGKWKSNKLTVYTLVMA